MYVSDLLLPSPFSLVLPVKAEYELLRRSLPSCYGLEPDELILCVDDPPHEQTVQEAWRIASRLGWTDRTKVIRVPGNPEYRFHQAWVRRQGFRRAKHDRILTSDADLILNRNVLKAISMVGHDNVGLASCTTLHSVSGFLGMWKAITHSMANLLWPPGMTGLYALWRPFWLDTEDEGIERLRDPRKYGPKGSLALLGEDVYLRNCMSTKHRCVHLKDVGGYNIRKDWPDRPDVQFELGRYYSEKKYRPTSVILRSFAFARPHLIRGYVYQKHTKERVPTDNFETNPRCL